MRTLNLGVVEQPYANGTETTGDVATILEAKYHIMDAFWRSRGDRAAQALEKSLAGELENLMMGAPPSANPLAGGEGSIKAEFDQFLTSGAIESMGIPGVPTKAALAGVSHRFKGRRNKGGRRPSFIDTGLFDTSFLAWMS